MSIQFSESTNNTGIAERARRMARVNSTQWPNSRIASSANDYLDEVAGYLIGSDRNFQWDDTNHTDLPEGTQDTVANQADYSFLTDELGNSIITLTGVSILNSSTGLYDPLTLVDRLNPEIDISTFGTQTGTPTRYDKIADNIIRLDYKPSANVSDGLKFFFQRTPSYFVSTDTTKTAGVSPLLHRGFVVYCAYDIAMELGLKNLPSIEKELIKERAKMMEFYSKARNRDLKPRMTVSRESNK